MGTLTFRSFMPLIGSGNAVQRFLRGLAFSFACFLVSSALVATLSLAQEWKAEGPAPTKSGQVEGIAGRPVTGAVHAIASHPTDASILMAGSVNGGIWRTVTARNASPRWAMTTDARASLSIGALAFDPTDATSSTLVAGIGRFSSSGRRGGPRVGLLLSTDRGESWTPDTGGGLLTGLNVSGVAPRGGTIVISVNLAEAPENRVGIWRRATATGAWTQISGATGTGLPAGLSFDVVGDPADNAVLYTNGGPTGLYRSNNTGERWDKVSDATIDTMLSPATVNVKFAVGRNRNVFVGIVNTGRLAGVFRSPNGMAPWTKLDLPQTTERGVVWGIHPGGQGGTHFSIVADPTDDNIAYVGGDRQPGLDEVDGMMPRWPNSLGAGNYTGRLFRIDASRPAGSQVTSLTHSGTASNSAPHADSRRMIFDADGNLLESDDGGIYRRTRPRDAGGDWASVNGDMQITEFYAIAWDAVAQRVIGGAQDTGTPEKATRTADRSWTSVHQGDGGDVAVDDRTLGDRSIRYSSAQSLSGFRRRVFNASNVLQGTTSLTPLPGDLNAQFVTPIEINNANMNRIVVGAANDIYESIDNGTTLVPLGVLIRVNSGGGRHPLAYGAADDENVLYAGTDAQIWVRTGTGALTQSAAYAGRTVEDIAIDPDRSRNAFAVDARAVFMTRDAGTNWPEVTGNLQMLVPGNLRTIEFIPARVRIGASIVVGADNGVFQAFAPGFHSWRRLGTGLPGASVRRLHYSAASQLLVAGTLGRGAWSLDVSRLTEPLPGIADLCRDLPSTCGRIDFVPERIDLRCVLGPCELLDPLPLNCAVKWGGRCPGCGIDGLCPPFYAIIFEDLDAGWDIALMDQRKAAVKHDIVRIGTRVAISFRPDKRDYIEGSIAPYVIAFRLNQAGKIGTTYTVKSILHVSKSPLGRAKLLELIEKKKGPASK